MLRDMEELILTIKDQQAREYMYEAYKCYSSESYRASIILSLITGMDDLHNKIKNIAHCFKPAKDLDDQILELIKKQSSYESFMIDQAESSVGIITPSERDILKRFLDIRNKCAHPSGHISSAEEARAIFAGIIDYILSKPPLLGTSYIKIIIEGIKDVTYFTASNQLMIDLNILKNISLDIINKMHSSAIEPLCKKLVDIILDKLNKDSIQKNNCAILLAGIFNCANNGLFSVENDKIKKIIIEKSELIFKQYSNLRYVSLMLIYSPDLLNSVSDTERKRIITNISTEVSNNNVEEAYKILAFKLYDSAILNSSERMSILKSIISKNDSLDFDMLKTLISILSEDEKKFVSESLCCFIERIIVSQDDRTKTAKIRSWKNRVLKLNISDLDMIFINKVIKLIDNVDYYISNDGSEILEELSEELLERINQEEQIKCVIAIINAAGRGANKAKTLINNGLSQCKLFYSSFIDVLQGNPEKIINYVYHMDKLVYLIDIAGDIAVLKKIMNDIDNNLVNFEGLDDMKLWCFVNEIAKRIQDDNLSERVFKKVRDYIK